MIHPSTFPCFESVLFKKLIKKTDGKYVMQKKLKKEGKEKRIYL